MFLILLLFLSAPGVHGSDTSWTVAMVGPEEPGEPLIISGVIYYPDGTTPAPGAVLSVYQTDARGYYHPPEDRGAQPRIRGWMKADSLGRYLFRTIKPGSYPGEEFPAHIHAKLRLPGGSETWLKSFWFDGDPFLSPQEYRKHARDGRFSPIMKLTRDSAGVLHGVRDLRPGN